jgi:hypothetical protein
LDSFGVLGCFSVKSYRNTGSPWRAGIIEECNVTTLINLINMDNYRLERMFFQKVKKNILRQVIIYNYCHWYKRHGKWRTVFIQLRKEVKTWDGCYSYDYFNSTLKQVRVLKCLKYKGYCFAILTGDSLIFGSRFVSFRNLRFTNWF